MTPPKLSALVICHNEQAHIDRCLRSLSWVDEILVVDAYSTDNTPNICQDPKAPWAPKIRFVQRHWDGFKNQRNFALRAAKFDWVLVVDSDEACSEELALKVRELLALPEEQRKKAYKVRRVEYFLGKPIRYGIWNPSYQDRLFHREKIEYINEVHEYPVFYAPPGVIQEPLLHAPDFDVEKFLYKLNKYTTIEATDRYKLGIRTHWIHILGAFPAMFLKNYFYYKAYRDGWHGVIISLLEGTSRLTRHIKLWQLAERDRQKTLK